MTGCVGARSWRRSDGGERGQRGPGRPDHRRRCPPSGRVPARPPERARLGRSTGRDALDVPWEVESPNAGFMLLDDDEIVGVQLAFYSERTIDGRRERFCNLGAWCVLPDYRLHSLRLLKAALSQKGYHFTDLSPSGNVIGINVEARLPLPRHDDRARPEPPLAEPAGRDVISSDPELIERTLTGRRARSSTATTPPRGPPVTWS